MEILLSAVVVLIAALVKWLTSRFGYEMARAGTLVLAFVLSGVAAYIYKTVDPHFWTELGKIFVVQMAFYEVIIKSVLLPVWEKFTKPQ